jgi:hypothetical protein
MEVTGIVFPNPFLSSPRHYVIWTKGKTPVTSRLFTPPLVDAETGQLTTAKGFGDSIWNVLSWIALVIPLVVIAWRLCSPKNAGS